MTYEHKPMPKKDELKKLAERVKQIPEANARGEEKKNV
jgi:hypothetical protein